MSVPYISILVTGSNQGLGFHVVQKLLTQADNLLIYAAARTHEKAAEAVSKFRQLQTARPSNSVEPIVIDLTDDATIEAAVAHISSLDILVNNAGTYVEEDVSGPSAIRKSLLANFNTNLFGTVALSTACLPKLQQARAPHRASIINVTSGLASLHNMTTPSSPQYKTNEIYYSSSKTALNAFTISMSKELPSMRIVAVAPGHSATALNGYSAPQSAETGAQYIVDAILDKEGPSGIYMQKDKEHSW